MRTLDQAGDISGKSIFLRADFDVPVTDGVIDEPFRIKRQKECLHWLIDHGAHVVIGAHISAIPSFDPIQGQLQELLDVQFGDRVTLLENLRSDPGEQANDMAYAKRLAQGCDLYVNNAFAVCHRAHASVTLVPTLLPSFAGPLIREEVRQLSEAIDAPAEGKIIFIGGAKVSTKKPVIDFLLNKAQAIAVGGKVANELGPVSDTRVHTPSDFVTDDGQQFDIGPETAAAYADLASRASMIVWNGPMGKFEDERYAAGTRILAQAIAGSSARTIIGGGDTIAAVNGCSIDLNQFGFVSTGGGAMLAFLGGLLLPGLAALE